MSDIVERLKSQSILDVWHPMMLEASEEIERQRKVISAMIEDCQYLKEKQIEAAAEIEKLRAALKPFAECEVLPFYRDKEVFYSGLKVGDLRAAAAALKETGE